MLFQNIFRLNKFLQIGLIHRTNTIDIYWNYLGLCGEQIGNIMDTWQDRLFSESVLQPDIQMRASINSKHTIGQWPHLTAGVVN